MPPEAAETARDLVRAHKDAVSLAGFGERGGLLIARLGPHCNELDVPTGRNTSARSAFYGAITTAPQCISYFTNRLCSSNRMPSRSELREISKRFASWQSRNSSPTDSARVTTSLLSRSETSSAALVI